MHVTKMDSDTVLALGTELGSTYLLDVAINMGAHPVTVLSCAFAMNSMPAFRYALAKGASVDLAADQAIVCNKREFFLEALDQGANKDFLLERVLFVHRETMPVEELTFFAKILTIRGADPTVFARYINAFVCPGEVADRLLEFACSTNKVDVARVATSHSSKLKSAEYLRTVQSEELMRHLATSDALSLLPRENIAKIMLENCQRGNADIVATLIDKCGVLPGDEAMRLATKHFHTDVVKVLTHFGIRPMKRARLA